MRLPNLRSFSVHGISEAPTFLEFHKEGELALSRGHKTLDKLDLRFKNAPDLFLPRLAYSAAIPHLSVRERFPSLSTLIIDDFATGEHIESLFGELPETLTTLSVVYHNPRLVPPRIDVGSIAKLPRHLNSLTLRHMTLIDPVGDDFEFFSLFPPNLEHLNLGTLSSTFLMDHWPSSLKNLHVSFAFSPSTFSWKASKIPPRPVGLNLDLDDWRLELDVPLPSTLEIFECPGVFKSHRDVKIDDMPIGIKNLDSNFLESAASSFDINAGSWEEYVFKRFPNLEKTAISSASSLACLPSRLKKLEFKEPFQISSSLPSSLTELILLRPLSSDSIKFLPLTFRTLMIGSTPRLMNRTYTEEVQREFPPWNAYDVAQLASTVRLETFITELRFFKNVSCLAPISKMETLKKFSLYRVGLEEMLSSPQWLPKCLPRYLNTLEFDYSDYVMNWAPWPQGGVMSDDFLRLSNLGEAVLHLRSLIMRCNAPRAVEFGPSFATLPAGLLNLCLTFNSRICILRLRSRCFRALSNA